MVLYGCKCKQKGLLTMKQFDFINTRTTKVTKLAETQENLNLYVIEFCRDMICCPSCNSFSIARKRKTTHNIYAIMNDKPSKCTLKRQEYLCRNAECQLGSFYNTNDHEDCYFKNRKFTPSFIYTMIQIWLNEKTVSIEKLGKNYGISTGSVGEWSLSMRENFDRRFYVATRQTMIFSSFTDKDGNQRGFVCSPTDNDKIALLSFVDDFSTTGLIEFNKRITSGKPIVKIYYDGSKEIGKTLQTLFGCTVIAIEEADFSLFMLAKINELRKQIINRVKKKDTYDSIVLKFLYDNLECRQRFKKAMGITAMNYGIQKPFDTNTMQLIIKFPLDSEEDTVGELNVKEFMGCFNKSPQITDYFAVY